MLNFKPITVNQKLYSYKAFENNKELGYCEFTINNQYAEIMYIDVVNNDSLIAEGLVRSALNFAANKNAYIAKVNPQIEKFDFFERMGFKKEDGIYCNDIPSALSCSCSNFA